MDILLDTNFIVAAMLSKANVRAKLEESDAVRFILLSNVLYEVGLLPPKERGLAEAFLRSEHFETIAAEGGADDALLDYAVKHGWAVATLDGGLKKRLKRLNVQVITLSKNRLVLV